MQNEKAQSLSDLVVAMGLSNADVARISGKSTSTVSQVLAGKYRGRPEVLDEILESVTAHNNGEALDTREWLTDGQNLIMSVLFLTYITQGFSVVVGPSGIGKTYTAKSFEAKHRDDVRYLRCSDGMSMGDVIDSLLEITSTPTYGSNSHRLKRGIRALQDQGVKMLIVDEADLLVTDGSKPKILKKISVFRETKEAGIGVALVGLESFDDALRAVGETYVTSRIDLFRRATAPSQAEFVEYMMHMGINVNTDAANRAISLAPKNGSLRFIQKAVQISQQLGGSMLEALRVLFAASDHVKGV